MKPTRKQRAASRLPNGVLQLLRRRYPTNVTFQQAVFLKYYRESHRVKPGRWRA